MVWFGFYNTTYHVENAEMTFELRGDLINFSFNNLQDVFKNSHVRNPDRTYGIFTFLPPFLTSLKKLVWLFLKRSLHTYIFYETVIL
jgi:hypothetical protein